MPMSLCAFLPSMIQGILHIIHTRIWWQCGTTCQTLMLLYQKRTLYAMFSGSIQYRRLHELGYCSNPIQSSSSVNSATLGLCIYNTVNTDKRIIIRLSTFIYKSQSIAPINILIRNSQRRIFLLGRLVYLFSKVKYARGTSSIIVEYAIICPCFIYSEIDTSFKFN